MEIRQLKTFRTVAKLLSFNRAADQLHYAQSSVSAQIHALEDELAVKLFDRLGRRILLTEAGERLLPYAEKILDLADQTRTDLADEKELHGSLTIRIPETLGVHRLPSLIKKFKSDFPRVQLSFITCAHEGLEKDLRKGITDLAFLLTESIQAADLTSKVLGFETIVMVASPRHPLAGKPTVRIGDLEGETILLSNVDCSYRKTFQQMLDQEGILIGTTLEFSSVEAIKRCVMAGVGVTILPEIAVAEEISQKRLVNLPCEEGKFDTALLMIWYKERWLSPTLNAFIRMTRKVLDNL